MAAIRQRYGWVLALAAVAALVQTSSGEAGAARLDPSFGTDGTVVFNHGGTLENAGLLDEYAGQAYALAIDSKDRILVGGGSGAAFLVLRYLPDGSLDQSFAEGGVFRLYNRYETGTGAMNPASSAPRIKAIVPRKNGDIALVGQSFDVRTPGGNGDSVNMIIMLDESGAQDMEVGSIPGIQPGLLRLTGPRAATYDRHGKLVIGGNQIVALDDLGQPTKYAALITRNLDDGSPDPHFDSPSGSFDTPAQGALESVPAGYPPYSAISAVKVLKNNRILAGGHDRNRLTLMRLTNRGNLDRSFGYRKHRGQTIANFGGRKCFCVAGGDMAVDSHGRIVQEGYSFYPSMKRSTAIALTRYLPNGKIDRRFGHNGFARSIHNPGVVSTSIALQSNGRILVTARLGSLGQTRFMLVRYLANGRIDRSFFNNGRYIADMGDVSTAEKVLIDSKGRAIVAGGSGSGGYTGHGSFVLKRFLLNGDSNANRNPRLTPKKYRVTRRSQLPGQKRSKTFFRLKGSRLIAGAFLSRGAEGSVDFHFRSRGRTFRVRGKRIKGGSQVIFRRRFVARKNDLPRKFKYCFVGRNGWRSVCHIRRN